MTPQQQLLEKIMQAELACQDIKLYLNTHPECAQSLTLFKQYSSEAKELTAAYESQFGLLCAMNITNKTRFDWIDSPWPWQAQGGN